MSAFIAKKNRLPPECELTMQRPDDKWRWLAVSVFIVSSVLNYLDRNLLNILAPLIMAELHFSQTRLGVLIAAFSIAYAAASLGAGWLLDRFGVNRTTCAAVAWWSVSAMCTGLVRGLGGLLLCRTALGLGEAAGVPAVGKLNGLYLRPKERALGAAVNQIGLSLGATLAPLWIGLATTRGWRLPLVINGALGFVWIPIWLWVSRQIPAQYRDQEFAKSVISKRGTEWDLLRDRNLLLLVLANVLWMGGYALWSQWTTLYLIHVHGLTLVEAGHYVWIPPIVSNLGGFFGGWLSLRWMERGRSPVQARQRAIWVSAAGSLLTLGLLFAPNAGWATAIISLSFFFALAGSVNVYALPIDLFGPGRSGLAISALTFAFGILQAVISPVIGFLGDHHLYRQVVWIATVPLLLSAVVLMGLRRPRAGVNAESDSAVD